MGQKQQTRQGGVDRIRGTGHVFRGLTGSTHSPHQQQQVISKQRNRQPEGQQKRNANTQKQRDPKPTKKEQIRRKGRSVCGSITWFRFLFPVCINVFSLLSLYIIHPVVSVRIRPLWLAGVAAAVHVRLRVGFGVTSALHRFLSLSLSPPPL